MKEKDKAVVFWLLSATISCICNNRSEWCRGKALAFKTIGRGFTHFFSIIYCRGKALEFKTRDSDFSFSFIRRRQRVSIHKSYYRRKETIQQVGVV